MRLFLSSYRAGRHSDKLVELLGEGAKVVVITNAKDYKTPQDREVKVNETLDFFVELGFNPEEVDLRKYFKNQANLQKDIADCNAVWLAGGNVFLLRRALNYTGLDKWLYDKVRKNEIIFGGESAGAIIAGPTLRFSEMEGDEDNPGFIAEGYEKEAKWDGLDFVRYVPVPHFRALDYGNEIENYIKRLDEASITHKEMTDDQAILINGGKEEFLA